MKFTIIKLKPKSSFHIGDREGWREGSKPYIPSDTIFSALCHCYGLLYDDLEDLLNAFVNGKPPFLITSAFPCSGNMYFFPVPRNQAPKEKALKKIKFIDLNGLEKVLSGKRIDDIARAGDIKTIPSNKPSDELWKTEDVPRVGLSRWSNHPGENYFHFGQVWYKDAGLFIIVDFKDVNFRERIVASFNLMVHEGIGGDRTCGKGVFHNPEISEIEIKLPSSPNAQYTLSLYFPRINELDGIEKGYYELESRKGYIYSPYSQSMRRRSVRMFSEGSIFPDNIKRLGTIVDVTPELFTHHRVYRYGFMFSLPCHLEEL